MLSFDSATFFSELFVNTYSLYVNKKNQFVFGGLTSQVNWLSLRVGGHPALSLYSSDEPDELSQ